MKKFLFLVAALLALGISTACADSDRPIDVAQLPQKAQQFIQKHFAGEKVALAKVERDFLEVRYEVIFTDGGVLQGRRMERSGLPLFVGSRCGGPRADRAVRVRTLSRCVHRADRP